MTNDRSRKRGLFRWFVFLLFHGSLIAPGGELLAFQDKLHEKVDVRPLDVTGLPRSALMNANGITMWASDNGILERRPGSLTAGVTLPRGTATAVSAGGAAWARRGRAGILPAPR